jgi:hypothetical protein
MVTNMRHTFAVLLVVLFALGAPAPAEAKHFRYRSPHPFRGGFCSHHGPHEHDYGPTDARVYRVVDGDYYFVGDPVAFGYEGPKYAY